MQLEHEVKASFYKEVAAVNRQHGVVLVQHVETGKIYVRKTLSHYDRSVFDTLKESRYPGIPVIQELIETDHSLIVVEDYISGQNLEEMLADGPFSMEQTISVVARLCDILAPMHARKPPIIHRDIKASNVLLDSEGTVYLIDFDASKQVSENKNRDTELIGTEAYAAPEQYGFGQSDQRTDIYALGILMHKLLTGLLPSETTYHGPLSQVIARATALDPKDRYRSVQMLKKALLTHQSASSKARKSDPERSLLMHIPYYIRELPGLRTGRPGRAIAALIWYCLIVCFSFFTKPANQASSAAIDGATNISAFLLLVSLTLYLGNYLGVRDRLPWKKPTAKIPDLLRIAAGVVLLVAGIILLVSIVLLTI